MLLKRKFQDLDKNLKEGVRECVCKQEGGIFKVKLTELESWGK